MGFTKRRSVLKRHTLIYPTTITKNHLIINRTISPAYIPFNRLDEYDVKLKVTFHFDPYFGVQFQFQVASYPYLWGVHQIPWLYQSTTSTAPPSGAD